jgi:predicted RNase H-like HicB family nuclease
MGRVRSTTIYNFTVIFEREADGGFHAYCPSLRGCHAQGNSYDEALSNIQEAIELYVQSLRAHREPIPTDDVLIKPLQIAV